MRAQGLSQGGGGTITHCQLNSFLCDLRGGVAQLETLYRHYHFEGRNNGLVAPLTQWL